MWRLGWFSLALLLGNLHVLPLASALAQPNSASNALALSIIAAWQNSSRAPTPQARAHKIEEALALAVPANPWPFREPARDDLLGQMWGQLGNEYRRVEGAQRSAALERAVAAYQEALKFITPKGGADLAKVYFGLAQVYLDRVPGERSQNIEKAISAFNAAAQIATKASLPSNWGSIQVGLSKAYWHRIEGRRADNLEVSIQAAEAALSVFTSDKAVADWSSAQQALGAAYWARIYGVRADNVDKAISAYEKALTVTTRERSAQAWAGLHDNLGMAYAERSRGTPLENIQRAAAHFESASKVFTREAFPADWAQLNMNFGLLLLDRELDKPAERIEVAIARFNEALTVYTPQAFPERWARVMLNLGIAYASRLSGDRADNIERAIAAYQNALQFYSRASDPVKWASAQNNLGIALRKRIRGERAANLSASIAAHEAAMSVFTSAAFPWLHLRSAQLAGEVAAARHDWSAAREFYRKAMTASQLLFAGGLNRAEAESVSREGGELFAGAAYVAVMLNAPLEALDIIESGRARLLRVALGLDALPIQPGQRARLESMRSEIRELEGRIEYLMGDERLQIIGRLEELRANAQRIIDAAMVAQGDASHSNALALAERLLTKYAVIVIPIVTENGATLLLVRRGAPATSVLPVPIPGLHTGLLNTFLHGADPAGRVGGWLGAYSINHLEASERQRRWQDWLRAVDELQTRLSGLFAAVLADALRANGVQRDSAMLWLPQGALGLLPIAIAGDHAAKTALIDGYTVSSAPSLAAAAAALRRASLPASPASLTAVINPTGDLSFTEPEGAVAISYFDTSQRALLGANDARREVVIASLGKSSHWHFATHGVFSWTDTAQSALLLADGERLTVRDLVDRSDLGHPRLVILSACETGVFDFQRTPDEFIGLPATFLQAGSAGVIGSLWPVDDTSTALIMMKFYDFYLAKNLEPALALRRAQLWLREATRPQIDAFLTELVQSARLSLSQESLLRKSLTGGTANEKPYAHPYYWAAFQFYGS
jgi:CHAT domain-containing protein/tetratricopeptide (TPR) repeat protein